MSDIRRLLGEGSGPAAPASPANLSRVKAAEAALRTAVRQQAAVAALGQTALAGGNIHELIESAIQAIERILVLDRASIGDLLLLAGGPAIADDLTKEMRIGSWSGRHGALAAMHPGGSEGEPEAREDYRLDGRRSFTQEDTYFLQAVANVLATAIRRRRVAVENARLYQDAQDQRRSLQTVLDSMMEGVVSLDTDLCVCRTNAFAKRLLGISEESDGRHCRDALRLTNEQGNPTFDLPAMVHEAISNRRPDTLEGAWLELPDGRRLPVALTITPQLAENGTPTGAVLLFRDMTRYRELDVLRESIISLVSHELRTPLFHIKGFANSLLQMDVEWDQDTRLDFIRTIDKEADRLTRLVGDILELAHVESGRLPLTIERVTPAELAGAGVAGARLVLAGHQVRLDVPATLKPVLADVSRMERVLVNVLENAVKYSRPGTSIQVSARARGREVVFSVADEGVGIPAEAFSRIFEKFIRLQDPAVPNSPGTGLGLTLCKAIVEAHGGRIWVESQVGRGSTFFFSLPLARRPQLRKESPERGE